MNDPGDKKGPTIQSLARAVAILEEVSRRPDGATLAQISKALGLHNSTAFHLAQSLVHLGCLVQDGRNKRYRIGPKVLALAATATDDAGLARIAEPYLEDLARRTGENSHLAVRVGSLVSVLARRDPDSPIRISERPGMTRPAHATATGKVLLAAMPPEAFDALIETMRLDALTPATITDPDRLRDEIRRVRETGVAIDNGEFHAEVRCLAVPLTGLPQGRTAALGISAPVFRLSTAQLLAMAPLVRDTAAAIAQAAG